MTSAVVPADVDVVVVGGGPAGLSAALVLGRSRRRVLVCDSGDYRNEGNPTLHGWLTRDGAAPELVRRLGREELARYDVAVAFTRVEGARRTPAGFAVQLTHGSVQARALVLATGLRDVLPPIPGLAGLVGRGVCLCPYCDAWEVRDQLLGVVGEDAGGLALSLRTWSPHVVLFTAGARPAASMLADLASVGVRVVDSPIARVFRGDPARPQGRVMVRREDNRTEACAALFVKLAGQEQRSELGRQLGLAEADGRFVVDQSGATSVPGVWVAGDASGGLQFVAIAVAEGATVGVAVNRALQQVGWGL